MKKLLIVLFFCPSISNAQPTIIQKNIWTVEQWAGSQTNWGATNERPHYFYAESKGKLIRLELVENEGKFSLNLQEVAFPKRTKTVTTDATASIMPQSMPQIEKAEIEGSFDSTRLIAFLFVGLLVLAIFKTEHTLGQLFWFAIAMWTASNFIV